jgi:hypothetical protein
MCWAISVLLVLEKYCPFIVWCVQAVPVLSAVLRLSLGRICRVNRSNYLAISLFCCCSVCSVIVFQAVPWGVFSSGQCSGSETFRTDPDPEFYIKALQIRILTSFQNVWRAIVFYKFLTYIKTCITCISLSS